MKYELWCGDVLLGHSELTFWQVSATTFAGDFDPVPGREEQLARIAIRVYCLRSWMDRDARDGLGRHVVRASFRASRLFIAIAEIVAARHDPAMQLRRPGGTVIPTRRRASRRVDSGGRGVDGPIRAASPAGSLQSPCDDRARGGPSGGHELADDVRRRLRPSLILDPSHGRRRLQTGTICNLGGRCRA